MRFPQFKQGSWLPKVAFSDITKACLLDSCAFRFSAAASGNMIFDKYAQAGASDYGANMHACAVRHKNNHDACMHKALHMPPTCICHFVPQCTCDAALHASRRLQDTTLQGTIVAHRRDMTGGITLRATLLHLTIMTHRKETPGGCGVEAEGERGDGGAGARKGNCGVGKEGGTGRKVGA